MTNKPMLSVELSALLERVATEANYMLGFTRASNYDECRAAVDELRALLDKPNAWPCWSCKKLVSMSGRADADGGCPHCSVELDIEAWPFPPNPATQHQGEPVAWMRFSAGGNPYCCNRDDHDDAFPVYTGPPAIKLHLNVSNVKVTVNANGSYTIDPGRQPSCSFCSKTGKEGAPWRSATSSVDGVHSFSALGCKDHRHLVDALKGPKPAPVAVVMPDRMADTWNGNRDYMTYDKGYNDALDEVARLNGVKP